jgi:hypothetical protein
MVVKPTTAVERFAGSEEVSGSIPLGEIDPNWVVPRAGSRKRMSAALK